MCCLSIPLPEYPASTMDNHANERIWNVPGDGNCLFRALVLAAEDKNILSMPLTHVSLRAMAVALVRNDVDGHFRVYGSLPDCIVNLEQTADHLSRSVLYNPCISFSIRPKNTNRSDLSE